MVEPAMFAIVRNIPCARFMMGDIRQEMPDERLSLPYALKVFARARPHDLQTCDWIVERGNILDLWMCVLLPET